MQSFIFGLVSGINQQFGHSFDEFSSFIKITFHRQTFLSLFVILKFLNSSMFLNFGVICNFVFIPVFCIKRLHFLIILF